MILCIQVETSSHVHVRPRQPCLVPNVLLAERCQGGTSPHLPASHSGQPQAADIVGPMAFYLSARLPCARLPLTSPPLTSPPLNLALIYLHFALPALPQAVSRRVSYWTFAHVLTLDVSFHLDKRTGRLSRILERGVGRADV